MARDEKEEPYRAVRATMTPEIIKRLLEVARLLEKLSP
jgi:hypothetical protein